MTRKKKERKIPKNGCTCTGCVSGDKYRWAVISECKCCCHDSTEPSGHSGLCCEYPNGVRKKNPYFKLEHSDVYKKQRDEYYKED